MTNRGLFGERFFDLRWILKRLWSLLLVLGGGVTKVNCLNLSRPESFFFGSRLARIQTSTRDELQQNVEAIKPLEKLGSTPVVVFPGAGGPDQFTNELESKIGGCCIVWDWQRHRGNIISAAFDGEAVGEAFADRFNNFEQVHIIGISVGAFCANAMASRLYSFPKRPWIRLTLLDPFCSRGVWGIGYGAKYFGVNADFAEQYMNTDDPVPTTNDPLPNCYCVDVTNAPQRDSFDLPPGETMHCWPVAFFARYGFNADILTHANYPRGKVDKL